MAVTREKVTPSEAMKKVRYGYPIADYEIDRKLVLENMGSGEYTISNCAIKELEICNDRIGLVINIQDGCLIEKLTLTGENKTLIVAISQDTTISELNLLDYGVDTFDVAFNVTTIRVTNKSESRKISNLTINQSAATENLLLLKLSGFVTNVTINSPIADLICEGIQRMNSLQTNAKIDNCKFTESQINKWTAVNLNSNLIDIDTKNSFHSGGIKITKSNIKHFKFDTTSACAFLELGDNKTGTKTKIHTLEFHSRNNLPRSSGQLHFIRAEFDTINFTGYSTLEWLVLKDIAIEKELDLTDISFGGSGSVFDVVDLRRCILKIYGTNFDNVEFNYVEWPLGNKFYEFDDEKHTRESRAHYIFKLKHILEVYRTMRLKFVAKSNMFDAMVFQANEMRTQYRIKQLETWGLWSLKSFKNNFGDWFILWSNAVFSNFGLSWTRPLLWWLLFFHLILVYFLLINFEVGVKPMLDISTLRFSPPTLEATGEGLDIYLKLLFPVHDSDIKVAFTDTNPPPTTDIWGALDFCIRIVSSYFIFLIIRGTRKFNFKIGS